MKASPLQKLLQKDVTRKEFLTYGGIAFASLFGIYGAYKALLSFAGTTPVSKEAEAGTTTSPAQVVTDSTASGGKAVKFGPTPPPPPPSGGTQPSGPGISLYQNLAGSKFSTRVNAAGAANMVSFPAGTFTFSNFSDGTQTISAGAFAEGASITAKGLLGSGAANTILEMVPSSSNKAGDVPAQSTGATNNLSLITMNTAGSKVDGITLQGTSQGHLYNGLRFETIASPTLTNSKIVAIPGSSSSPPGETFHANFQRASGTVTVTNVEFDGAQIGATGLGTNSCSANLVIDNVYSHDMKYSAGAAFWQQTGHVQVSNSRFINNERALGFERCNCVVDLIDCVFSGSTSGHDMQFSSDTGTGTLNFRYSSTATAPTTKVKVLLGTMEQGHPQLNTQANVNVYVGGVKVTTTNYVQFF